MLKHIEQIGIVIFMIAIILSVSLSYWKYALLTAGTFIIFGICYLLYSRISINSGVCTVYHARLVYNWGIIKKKSKEIPFSEIEEIYYQQGSLQRLFNIGTIVIKRKTRNLMGRFTYIESIKNVDKVFEKIQEVFK